MSRRTLDLTAGPWLLGQAPADALPGQAAWRELERVEEWLPAQVPGNVRADLVRAGRLPDLTWGTHAESAQWVDDHCWWLIHDFPGEQAPTERVHLVLRGVDYIGDLFLNGHFLGRHEGMFSPQIHDITPLLLEQNRLAVRILGNRWLPQGRSRIPEKLLNHLEGWLGGLPGRFPHRRDTLKCQMGFGWDFAPPLRTMGIWDEVYAIASDRVYIQDVAVRSRLAKGAAALSVTVELDAAEEIQAQVRCLVSGETFESAPHVVEQPLALRPGPNQCTLDTALPEPRLWWPWDHGRPDLYRLAVEVRSGGRVLDHETRPLGLRRVELDGWTLRINGRRVYARGANWVPASILPGCVTQSDYEALLTLAREANMNMLRVWGGGLREKRAFYQLCDRLGILVWQEFPLACAFLTRYPRAPEFLQLLEGEARAIVRDLRDHPSVVLWCGGNEWSPRRNAPVVEALARAVAEEDPSRPFVPASPATGDSHNWRVWHHFEPPETYRQDAAPFASEFGLQALPDMSTLRRFLPPEELQTPGPSWAYHGAGLRKLERYARPFLEGREPSPGALVEASQRAQAHGLQIAIEHYRRRKAHGCGGALVWQLNDPWPAISWSLLDYDRRPKAAYARVKDLFNPILVSLDYPLQVYAGGSRFGADVWLINDGAAALPHCRVEAALVDGAGQEALVWYQAGYAPADWAGVAGRIDWTLPPGDGWRVTCRLVQDGQLLAANEYDLSVYDGIRPTLWQRLRDLVVDLLLPA